MKTVARTRDDHGGWHSRKRIPNAVRDEYHRLHGQRHEAKFFAPATTPDGDAKLERSQGIGTYGS